MTAMTRIVPRDMVQEGLLGLVRRTIDLAERFPMALLELAFRVAVGAVFFKSGLLKLSSWETTIALFTDEYHVPLLAPELAATLAATAELICPVMLVMGLGARLAAAALLFMTLVIQVFVYPDSWTDHLLWSSLLAYILTRGPGALSLDRVIASHLLRRR